MTSERYRVHRIILARVARAGFGAVVMIVIPLVVVVMISIGMMRADREFSWRVG